MIFDTISFVRKCLFTLERYFSILLIRIEMTCWGYFLEYGKTFKYLVFYIHFKDLFLTYNKESNFLMSLVENLKHWMLISFIFFCSVLYSEYSSSKFPMKVGVGFDQHQLFKVYHVLWYFFSLLKSYTYPQTIGGYNLSLSLSLLFLCYTMKGYMKIQISTYLSISLCQIGAMDGPKQIPRVPIYRI